MKVMPSKNGESELFVGSVPAAFRTRYQGIDTLVSCIIMGGNRLIVCVCTTGVGFHVGEFLKYVDERHSRRHSFSCDILSWDNFVSLFPTHAMAMTAHDDIRSLFKCKYVAYFIRT